MTVRITKCGCRNFNMRVIVYCAYYNYLGSPVNLSPVGGLFWEWVIENMNQEIALSVLGT